MPHLIITDIIRPGLDLQQLWQWAYIAVIIGTTTGDITAVIITGVIITYLSIPGTGIKLIITIIIETGLLLFRIIWPKAIMATGLQPDEEMELLPLHVHQTGCPIVRQTEPLHQRVHPQERLIVHQTELLRQRAHLQEHPIGHQPALLRQPVHPHQLVHRHQRQTDHQTFPLRQPGRVLHMAAVVQWGEEAVLWAAAVEEDVNYMAYLIKE
jgi:hypothetical protein